MNKKIIKNTFLIFCLGGIVYLFSLPLPLARAQYDIKEMTPDVKAALDNRRSRFHELEALEAQGVVGENNRGYAQALTGDLAAQSLVDAENQDRRVIYKTIARQNNLGSEMGTIESVFAQVQRDKAKHGDKIQTEDGEWITK